MTEVEQERRYPAWSILDRVDPSEWMALSEAAKQVFQLLVSAGEVRVYTQSSAWNILLGLFSEDTNTGKALRLL